MFILETAPDNIISAILWALCGLVVAEGMALVWLLKSRKNGNGNGETYTQSGKLRPEEWDLRIAAIVRTEVAGVRQMLHDVRGNQIDMKSGDQVRDRKLDTIITKLEDIRLQQGETE